MRVFDVRQRSEEWEKLRLRPTASQFGRIVTPVKGDYSKKSIEYACELVARQLGIWTEPPPSYWMDWGTENEPFAVDLYEEITCQKTEKVGFVMPDHTDTFGGSPDRLVGDFGLLEVKCPAPQTLIKYHANGEFPSEFKPQIQGNLLITGRDWCDFFVFHPALEPFRCRVEPDLVYQHNLLIAIERFLSTLKRVRLSVKSRVNTVWCEQEDLV